MLQKQKRRLAIAGAGVVAAALAGFAPPAREPELARPVAKGESPRQASSQPSSPFAALPARAALGAASGDPFGAPVMPVHRAAGAKAEPPPAPVAPPNPYTVAGTVVQGGTKRVYLLNGDRVYEARQGDELDGGYRVETIATDQVVLLYMPLGKKEQLVIGATLGADLPIAEVASTNLPPEGTSPAAKPAVLRWEGPQTVRAGDTFTLVLRVTSSQGLRATPMQLSYEPKLLEPVEVRAGKFFGEGNFSYRVNPGGSIFVGASGEGAAPGADAELVTVTFRTIKAGTTVEVTLSALALQGPAGRALPHNQVAAFRTSVQ